MANLPDLEAEALNHINNPGEGDASTSDDHPAPETSTDDDAPAPELEASTEQQTPAELQAVADLSKYKEVTIDGQKMSLDDLKKSIMRHSDYTKKTQELAKHRADTEKYSSNVWADLEKVKANPQLAAEFKRLYPPQYHRALSYVLQGATPQQATQQPQGLPPELEEKFSRYDQFIDEQNQAKVEAEQQALDATLQAAETNLSKKYPRADAITAYTLADNHRAKLEQETGQKMKPSDINEKFMEPFFKASHEYVVKQFNSWQKEQAKQAQNVHRQASDVGRGGTTPGQAPKSMKLKDVADEIISGGGF